MHKNDLALFKQAINEGIDNKLNSIVSSYTEEIECSERHKLAMRTIVYGKVDEAPKRKKLPMKRIIAIIVAAALLLTSCGIIFRNQIREIFEDVFVRVNYGDEDVESRVIDETYVLTYVPEGYSLEREIINPTFVQYEYVNEENESIVFSQMPSNSSKYVIDSETGYSEMLRISERDVYYRLAHEEHIYIWSDEKYSLKMKTTVKMSEDEIALIINGISIK